jgi:hypothetical protein
MAIGLLMASLTPSFENAFNRPNHSRIRPIQ